MISITYISMIIINIDARRSQTLYFRFHLNEHARFNESCGIARDGVYSDIRVGYLETSGPIILYEYHCTVSEESDSL